MFGRIVKSFFVNLLFLALAVGLVFLMVRGAAGVLTDDFMDRYVSSTRRLSEVAGARGQLLLWTLAAFGSAWLVSSLFLVSAERASPQNRDQGAARIGLWTMLLVALGVMLAITAWFILFDSPRVANLAPNVFSLVFIGGILLVLLAYYFATGLAVKRTMRPSVPLGEALPTFWS